MIIDGEQNQLSKFYRSIMIVMLSWSITNKMVRIVFSAEEHFNRIECIGIRHRCELSTVVCLLISHSLPSHRPFIHPLSRSFHHLMGAFVNQMWIWHYNALHSQFSPANFHEYSHINDNQSSCSHSSIVSHFPHIMYVSVSWCYYWHRRVYAPEYRVEYCISSNWEENHESGSESEIHSQLIFISRAR